MERNKPENTGSFQKPDRQPWAISKHFASTRLWRSWEADPQRWTRSLSWLNTGISIHACQGDIRGKIHPVSPEKNCEKRLGRAGLRKTSHLRQFKHERYTAAHLPPGRTAWPGENGHALGPPAPN